MGYGPESIEPSEGGLSRRFPTGMRPPNEGTALSISDKELELFTGIIEIQQDKAGGGCVISGNPIDWLSLAAERLRERRISPAKWVAAVMPRLADSVRGSSLPADARLTSLEATVQGMAFVSFLGADDSPHDSLSLFNVVATHMPDTPPAHVSQERRAAGQCLECGESTSHWRFTECPRVRANPQLMETMREWLRRERASRPPQRRREQATPAPPRDASRPARPSSSVDRAHLNTAIAALQATNGMTSSYH